MNYRSDIDGLRALAVLPVILFHAGFSLFKGGFSGVDIFFVISGYLITSIILQQQQGNNFSILAFYERRARRILPALFLVMFSCIPFALYFLWPNDLENFGQSLVATVLFSNNILLFLTSTDYWGLGAEFKPLLHTWSLGVEEQYYLIFPILMLALSAFKLRAMLLFFILLASISFALSLYLSSIAAYHAASFYLLPSRFWQILIGSCCAIYLNQLPLHYSMPLLSRNILSGLGFIIIIISFLTLDSTSGQSLALLLPTLGAALIIIFSDSQTIIGKFLSLRPLVLIGLISFSLYLWHQPIYAFLRASSLIPPSTINYLFAIVVTFILSVFSFKVETYFRDLQKVSSKLFFSFATFSACFLISIGTYFHFSSGMYSSYDSLMVSQSEEIYPLDRITQMSSSDKINIAPPTNFFVDSLNSSNKNAAYVNKSFTYLNKEFSYPDKKNLLVFGDSFSRDFINMGSANNYFSDHEVSFINFNCFEAQHPITPSNLKVLHEADVAIISYRQLLSEDDVQCLNEQVKFIQNQGMLLLIVGTKDFGYNMNAPFRRNLISWQSDISHDILEFNTLMKNLYPDIYIDLISLVATDNKVSLYTEDKKFISSDGHHLTYHGARHYGKILFSHPQLSFLQ
jgi:peptidoglycan/LPS O-acetylase OafA/YrhL